METLWQDIKYGYRMLVRSPGLSFVIILTLTIGIGVNTALFSLVDWLWLRSSPFSDPDRVVRLFATSGRGRQYTFSYPDYLDLQNQMPSFDGLAAVEYRGPTLHGEPWSKNLLAGVVSRNFFSVLGVKAAKGYMFSEQDDQEQRNLPGVVIGHRLWKSQFNGDPNTVGQSIDLSGRSRIVLGIAPSAFTSVRHPTPTDIWYPIQTWGEPEVRKSRRDRTFMLLGRLRSNTDIQAARNEAQVAFARLELKDLSTLEDLKPVLLTEPEYRTEQARSSSLFLISIALVVLVIACANISGLLLAKAEARSNEISVRQALGCSRFRLIRQLLTEGWLLSLLSAGCSLLLVYWILGLLRAFLPPTLADTEAGIRLNTNVIGFSIVLSFMATLLFGLVPTFHALRSNLLRVLRADTLHASHGRRTLFSLDSLVVSQLALALVLTVVASLLFRSFQKLTAVDLGFVRKDILLAEVYPSCQRNELPAFYRDLRLQVLSLPNVKNASFAIHAPFGGSRGGYSRQVSLLDSTNGPSESSITVNCNIVDPHYFETLGIQLLRGRRFTERDVQSDFRSVVINEAMARRFWPDKNPIGQLIGLGQNAKDTARVIGIVRDGRYHSIADSMPSYMFIPFGQDFSYEMTLLVETEGNARALIEPVRKTIQRASSDISLYPMTTLGDSIRKNTLGEEIVARLVGFLSLLGLFLAAVGLYGVIAFTVSRRTHELGIRMAVGAGRHDIIRLILWKGFKLSLIGLGIGLIGALIAGQTVKAALYGISPLDPTALVLSLLVLLATTMLACFVPARRAAKIAPMEALRYE
jgi:predicted permease